MGPSLAALGSVAVRLWVAGVALSVMVLRPASALSLATARASCALTGRRHVQGWACAFVLARPRSAGLATTRRASAAPAAAATASAAAEDKARDFFVEIPDVTLPGEPMRKVHVLDSGLPSSASSAGHPPLVLVGGTAQVINSWVGHIQALARDRRFIIYEARGQGRTELDLEGAAMPVHVEDFRRVCDALGLGGGPVDLAGFSFGGRVSLAAAAECPERVRRLVLTGVPADRDALGRLIIRSWRASLERGNLEEFAWSSMLQCHDRAFLAKFEKRIPEWVDFVAKNNRAEGILSIVSKSHTTDAADPFHTVNLAKRVRCPTLLLGGQADRVAARGEIERLAAEAGKGWPVVLIPGTGHNCVFEDPSAWRRHLLEFLS